MTKDEDLLGIKRAFFKSRLIFLFSWLQSLITVSSHTFEDIDKSFGFTMDKETHQLNPPITNYKIFNEEEKAFFKKFGIFFDKNLINFEALLKENNEMNSDYLTTLTYEYVVQELKSLLKSHYSELLNDTTSLKLKESGLYFFKDLCYLHELIIPIIQNYIVAGEQNTLFGENFATYNKSLIEEFV